MVPCVLFRFRRCQSYTDHSLGRENLLGFKSGELAVAIMNCRKSRRVCSDMDHFARVFCAANRDMHSIVGGLRAVGENSLEDCSRHQDASKEMKK